MKRLAAYLILLFPGLALASPSNPNSPYTVGQIISVTITGNGTGSCVNPTVTFAAPSGGVTATGTVTVSGGVVTGVVITAPGSDYITAPTVTFVQDSCTSLPTGTAVLGTLATLQWRVWTTGSNSNGGCFDTSLGGTNFANQAAAQVVFSSGNSNQLSASQNSTTVTSAGTPFTSGMVGNCIQITGGTNFVTGIYEVTAFTSSSQVTFDRAPATAGAGSAGNGDLGGALATLDSTSGLTVYQEGATTAYLKATASYTPSTGFTMPAGVPGVPTIWRGYTSTDNDQGQITIAPTAQITVITAATYTNIENILCDGGSSNFFVTSCVTNTKIDVAISNVTGNHFSGEAFLMNSSGGVRIVNSLAENGKSGCTAGFQMGSGIELLVGDVSTGNPCSGFASNGSGSAGTEIIIHCISYGNTGATSHGFVNSGNGTVPGAGSWYINNIAYNNGGAGFEFSGADSFDSSFGYNNLSVNNGTYGYESAVTSWPQMGTWDYNASNGNTTADLHNLSHGLHDFCASGCNTTLSGNPFTNAGSGNFSLNNTANQGAALRAKGFPGSFPLSLTTGFLDVGAAQTQCSGSGSSQSACAY